MSWDLVHNNFELYIHIIIQIFCGLFAQVKEDTAAEGFCSEGTIVNTALVAVPLDGMDCFLHDVACLFCHLVYLGWPVV